MNKIVLSLLLLPSISYAGEIHIFSGNRGFKPVEGAAYIGEIELRNTADCAPVNCGQGDTEEDITVTIEEGKVVTLHYNNTQNTHCEEYIEKKKPCSDIATVIDVPEGYLVQPEELIIPEGGTAKFQVFIFRGM